MPTVITYIHIALEFLVNMVMVQGMEQNSTTPPSIWQEDNMTVCPNSNESTRK